MEKIFKTSLFVLAVILYLGSTAFAEKRMDIISMSSGYPSGANFTLNIHGKDNTFTCASAVDGNSIFISEYGNSTITYISNRQKHTTDLTVLDSCSEAFDEDAAQVKLPFQADGYYVFARLGGKPDTSSISGDPVLLVPNPVLKACNDTDQECSGSLMTLGVITSEGVYKMTQKGLFLFYPNTEKGGGKVMVQDITGLFQWTGYVLKASLDTSGPGGVPDGVIDIYDLPMGFDADGDWDTDQADFDLWLKFQTWDGYGRYYENRYLWDIVNDGSKLLTIMWYPVSTTSFIAK
jgi:hypothetical protein